jgi:N-acyl-D-aspartate/D-glutamate deacylase
MGAPVATLVNGVEVMKNGQIAGKPDTGRFVAPFHNSSTDASDRRRKEYWRTH